MSKVLEGTLYNNGKSAPRGAMQVNPAVRCVLLALAVLFVGDAFRKSGCASLVAATLTVGAASGTGSPSLRSVRIGFLGRADIISPALLKPAARLDTVVIGGFAARSVQDANDFKEQHLQYLANTTVYSSYSALITSPDIDCVYVALPTSLHFEWAALALAAGKHVLLEKPLTSNAVQAEALVALAQQRNLVLMHGLHNLHHPMIPRMRALVRLLGKLRRAEARLIMPKQWIQQKGSRCELAAHTYIHTHSMRVAKCMPSSERR